MNDLINLIDSLAEVGAIRIATFRHNGYESRVAAYLNATEVFEDLIEDLGL